MKKRGGVIDKTSSKNPSMLRQFYASDCIVENSKERRGVRVYLAHDEAVFLPLTHTPAHKRRERQEPGMPRSQGCR